MSIYRNEPKKSERRSIRINHLAGLPLIGSPKTNPGIGFKRGQNPTNEHPPVHRARPLAECRNNPGDSMVSSVFCEISGLHARKCQCWMTNRNQAPAPRPNVINHLAVSPSAGNPKQTRGCGFSWVQNPKSNPKTNPRRETPHCFLARVARLPTDARGQPLSSIGTVTS